MKTFFKRSKHLIGLGFVALVIFSGFMTFTPQTTPKVFASCPGSNAPASYNDCGTIFNGCPGAQSSVPDNKNTDIRCAFNAASGAAWVCPVATNHSCIMLYGSDMANAPRIKGTGSGDSRISNLAGTCPPATGVPGGYNCGNIPPGCPGSTQPPSNPAATITCTYKPAANSGWTCPAAGCSFDDGTFIAGNTGTPAPPQNTNNDCRGANAPPGTDCKTIPTGCPGGPTGPIDGTLTSLTCPYTPAANTAWTCPVDTCNFSDGSVVTKGKSQPDTSGSNNETDPDLDCGTTKTKLDWIICPVVKMVNTGINALDNAITALLSVDPQIVNEHNADSGARYYKAWGSFRNIGMGIIVIAALIMLISQALGFDVFDAYTVKKVMPRVVIAIIGMALSWEIMKFFITFTNDLGLGVRHLIYFPFQGINNGNIVGGGEGVILTLIAVPAIFAMGIGILLSFAGTALLGLMIAFLVLILRQLVIVVLILTAPLAIACYVLPNTQNLWKLWHESFSKALLMFPIIMAFLATGRVFAEVASGPTATTLSRIIAFIAYIIPYFMIPVTFRFAGGALRTVGGFVNDRSRGVFDGLKKGRQARMKDRVARAKSQHLYNPSSKMGRFGNKVATWATDPGSNAAYSLRKVPGFRTAGAHVASQVEHAKVSQSSKLFEELNKSGYNDKAYRILSGAHGQIGDGTLERSTQQALADANLLGKAPKNIVEMQKIAEILSHSTNAAENIAASAIEGSSGKLATLYKDHEMGKADLQAAGIMGLAAHGFADGDDLAKVGNDLQGKNGEGRGYAQAVISTAQVMGARSRPDVKAGYGIVYDNGTFHNGLKISGTTGKNRAKSLVMSLQPQDLAGAKSGAVKALKPEIDSILTTGSPHEVAALEDQIVSWAGPYSSASNDVKVEALKIINDQKYAGTQLAAKLARATQQAYNPQANPMAAPGTPGGPPPPTPPGGNPPGGNQQSDIRLKHNISKLYVTSNGIQIYQFQYLWSDQVYIGVMAQDLMHTHPEVLSQDEYGYYRVNYEKLGLRMMTLEEWEAAQSETLLRP